MQQIWITLFVWIRAAFNRGSPDQTTSFDAELSNMLGDLPHLPDALKQGVGRP